MPLAHTSVTVHGLDLLVDYYFYPASKGARDSFGVPLEPDDPGSVELMKIETFSGDDITDMLSDRVWKEIETKIMEGDDE